MLMRDALMTVDEVMAYLKISRSTIYRLIKADKLKPVKIGGSTRFYPVDIERFIREA